MKILLFLLFGILVSSCKPGAVENKVPFVKADSLVAYLNSYVGKKVKLEGKILHVCPVKGRKMKLLCDNKAIVKIVPADTTGHFEHSWNGKRIIATGTVQELRLSGQYIDSITSGNHALCHIDHTPCIDTAWAAAMQRQGKAKVSLQRDSANLHQLMQTRGTDYVSVIVLSADWIETATEASQPAG